MTILWTIISGFLYLELVVIALLLLPIISPTRWRQVFSASLLRSCGTWATFYFRSALAILTAFFLDSVRETYKYEGMHHEAEKSVVHHEVDMEHINMRLFHAQRNLYISGFAIFCCFVINRLVKLISELARTEAQSAASMAQARSATEMANKMMDDNAKNAVAGKQKSGNEAKRDDEDAQTREIASLKSTLKKLTADCEAMRSQSTSVNREYDRLLAEHEKLQSELERVQADSSESSSKKDK